MKRPKFSLRTLLLVCCLAAAGFGLWYRWEPWVIEHILRGHTDNVNSAVFSPCGRFALTSSDDHTARLWDVSTGRTILVLRGHTGPISMAIFSPDGRNIVTGSRDKTVRLWNANTGEVKREIEGHKWPVEAVRFSADGKSIHSVTGLRSTCTDDNWERVWDPNTGRNLETRPGPIGGGRLDMSTSPMGDREVYAKYQLQIGIIFYRRRPEYWYGVAWLPEFWLTLAFGLGLARSLGQDWRGLRSAPAPQANPAPETKSPA